MNIFKLNIFHQIAPVEETTPADTITAREDFTINVDGLTVTKILHLLRSDTIEFTEKYNLTWGVTDFSVHNVPVRVKLTENQDVWYYVDGELAFNMQEAVALIKAQAVQF